MCPECQRSAAVGVQCVDCVREAAGAVRTARTVFGGQVVERPVVTQTIIGICLAVFVVQLAVGDAVTEELMFWAPASVTEPWRFITAAFAHSPSFLLHIAFNMLVLWQLGPYLEGLLGRWRFAAGYLISGVAGSVCLLLLANPHNPDDWGRGAVGASGAVFGLFGMFLVVNRQLQRDNGGMVAILVINGVLGFVIPNIAWQAHLGGLLAGAATAAVLVYAPRERRLPVQAAGLIAICAALLLLTLWKLSTVPEGALCSATVLCA